MSTLHDLPVDLATAPATPVRAPRPHLRAVPDVAVPDVAVEPAAVHTLPDLPDGFEDAVRRITPRLQRYVTRRLGDRHEAEELVQEALLRAYQHADTLRTEDDLAAWCTVVSGRLVIDRLRVRGRSTSVAEVPDGLRTSRDTADVVVARDEARTALDALDAMPPRQAAVLWAREVEGLGYDAIGERYGMTEPAVRSLLSRARKALRREFAVRGGTLPAGGLALLAPWADTLTWLDRLRRAAGRTVTPASVAVLGLGVLGGALVAPATFEDPADTRPAVVRAERTGPARAVLAPRAAAPAAPAGTTSRVVAPAAPAPAAPAPAPAQPDLLERVRDTCVGSDELSAGGYGCGTRGGDEVLLVPVAPLPEDLPLDGGAGLEVPAPVCRTLPVNAVPAQTLVRCTPEETS